jgi:hypothetical protein
MASVEGTVEFDTSSSVVLRLRKRDIAHVMTPTADPDTSLTPRPTGSDIKRFIAAGSVRAHPFIATSTAGQISSRICRIAERKEFRKILEAGQWCPRAQSILETWLLKAPRHAEDRVPAIEDAEPDPASAPVLVPSSSSSSDSSSSSSSDAMPDSDDMAGDEGYDAAPDVDGLQTVAAGFDVTTLDDDDIEQHPHWVNLNDQVEELVSDNERLTHEVCESKHVIKRLRLLTESQARLIASMQHECGLVQ